MSELEVTAEQQAAASMRIEVLRAVKWMKTKLEGLDKSSRLAVLNRYLELIDREIIKRKISPRGARGARGDCRQISQKRSRVLRTVVKAKRTREETHSLLKRLAHRIAYLKEKQWRRCPMCKEVNDTDDFRSADDEEDADVEIVYTCCGFTFERGVDFDEKRIVNGDDVYTLNGRTLTYGIDY